MRKPILRLQGMKRPLLIAVVAASTALLSACSSLFERPAPKKDAHSILNEAWTFIDHNYSFLGYKNVDWAATKPLYAAKVYEGMSDDSLFRVVGDMLYTLRDGHVNLKSDFDFSRNWTWFLNYPANYNETLLERNYFRDKQQYISPFTIYDFGDVGYIRYSEFVSFSESKMDYILYKFADRKGLVFDLRSNGGGEIAAAFAIAARFAAQEQLVARTQYKNGAAHDAFSELQDEKVTPYSGVQFTKPIVLLTNRGCYSAASFFTQFMRALPNVTVLGDTTGGGGGAPAQTVLANGWVLRCSATRTFAPDGFNIESGVPCDTVVNLTPADEANGVDTMLEEALKRLRR